MVATSATRDAENSQEFTDRVIDVLGVAPEVISGDEEARLSFTGATRELAGTALAAEGACPPPYLVTDIGGGSTEFILGGPGGVDSDAVGEHRLRPDDRTAPARRPAAPPRVADTIADIDAALDLVAAAVPVDEGQDAGRAGRVGDHGRRDRARP